MRMGRRGGEGRGTELGRANNGSELVDCSLTRGERME